MVDSAFLMTHTATVQLLSRLDGVLSCLIDRQHQSLKSDNKQYITYQDIKKLFKMIQTNFDGDILSCNINDTCAVLITRELMINSPGQRDYRMIKVWPNLNSCSYTRASNRWEQDMTLQLTSEQDVKQLISDAMIEKLDANNWYGFVFGR